MIELEVQGDTIELVTYSEDASLDELKSEVDGFRVQEGLKTATCAGCGECCFYDNLPVLGYDLGSIRDFLGVEDEVLFSRYLELPERPSMERRAKAVGEMMRDHGFDAITAGLLYEYNQAEPIRLRKGPAGSCMFLENDLCTIYDSVELQLRSERKNENS